MKKEQLVKIIKEEVGSTVAKRQAVQVLTQVKTRVMKALAEKGMNVKWTKDIIEVPALGRTEEITLKGKLDNEGTVVASVEIKNPGTDREEIDYLGDIFYSSGHLEYHSDPEAFINYMVHSAQEFELPTFIKQR